MLKGTGAYTDICQMYGAIKPTFLYLGRNSICVIPFSIKLTKMNFWTSWANLKIHENIRIFILYYDGINDGISSN